MSDSPPREPRASVILYARIDHAGRSVEVRVRNLSATGACIENPGELNQGDQVAVTMGTLLELPAEVMWTSTTLAGFALRRGRDRSGGGAQAPRPWRHRPQAERGLDQQHAARLSPPRRLITPLVAAQAAA